MSQYDSSKICFVDKYVKKTPLHPVTELHELSPTASQRYVDKNAFISLLESSFSVHA